MAEIRVVNPLEIEDYLPPNHTGTVNKRLVGQGSVWSENVEIVLGRLEQGGEAHEHKHDNQEQFIYVLDGEGIISTEREEIHFGNIRIR